MNKNLSVSIYEPIYRIDQSISDKNFSPLIRLENSRPDWREFQIFLEIYRNGMYRNKSQTGVFSPKFSLKCKISSTEFLNLIHDNPGYDVYFINPFPQIAYWSFNVWMQGEIAHPGLCTLAQKLFDVCKLDINLKLVPRHGPNILLYSNFWVGSEKFWTGFVGGWLLPIAEFLENNPEHTVTRAVMKETGHTSPTPFLPFIIERLFSTFLSITSGWKYISYPIDDNKLLSYCVTDYEKILYDRMRSQILEADFKGEFTPDLIFKMEMVSTLWQQHFNDFFASNIHPHTGSIVPKHDAC
ncbi:hypothetical protein QN362_11995 [Actimicrobium sp. CCC2.4]|uniref:hypothetical protein n=1 Tax=Actimicrobium sp. CCC2.4 TaxID=3048606 RepID=UPI002AC8B1F9|nr:hypothetical protein [Actimicrobium sp. CCC2.4]MEB0136053.1 hypothetical protein [Actimicrobium sp. CCC2.4]WPX32189.1 hypothetical protein RHM62_18505 [Actimicrobium sp. CCC2.4]